jgi:hypothetical protein
VNALVFCLGLGLLSFLVFSYVRYRYYKLNDRPLLPEKVTAHIIDQPGGEYVRVLRDGEGIYDCEGDEWP